MVYDGSVIIGSSGFVGSRLVKHLVDRGAKNLCALDIAPPRVVVPGVRYESVDVRSPIPVEFGCGASLIYNLAATHRTPGHPPDEYFETNIAGAINVVALAKSCDVKTIVFTSSISVYGPCEDEVSETSQLTPVSSYGRSKRLAEQIHTQWLADAPDRRLVTVRPGVIFGPGEGGNYTALARSLSRGYFFYPGRRTTVKSGGYVDELLRTMDFALSRPERYCLYNFVYPDQSTIQEIVNTFGRVMGRRYTPMTLPWPLLRAAAAALQATGALGLRTVIHPDRVMKLVQSTRIAPGWLLTNGYEFSTNLKTALENWRDETGGRFD